ncbi:cobalamin-independent methionine synthase II family protein [Pseudonocardia kujensis]|uniref:cobalamin-independent methionine synthase II family protein n=1 Tax=Pseudonocardia kujensis TaxID=1128675 RepID=UPI001E4DA76B|nr:cobalamin-independent methionine synthase II family protein [Pseudonocardia kujensis]MCE0767733.1 cobalamin-independent methionine synthase II family protein [Pseudonocardia kujensis]
MKTSTNRFLTTHTGSLPRPRHLLDLYGRSAADEVDAVLAEAVKSVVAQQVDTGIDVINDGEFGKAVRSTGDADHGHGTWNLYICERVTGLTNAAEDTWKDRRSKDRAAFSGYYGDAVQKSNPNACVGEVRFQGDDLVDRDLKNLTAALGTTSPAEAFLPAVSPASIVYAFPNIYYSDDDEYRRAVAEAVREEYLAIAEAGFTLQIDDPVLVASWDVWPDSDLQAYRRVAARDVELLNHALRGIPAEQVRYHLCWGSWNGPHSTDLPLADIVDLMLQVSAGGYVVEAANPQHEHEWKVWKDVRLPDDKILIPGVVTHKTPVIEHPEVVADRIVRYAEVVGRERVVAGTDCGVGGRIAPDVAWAKLASLVEGAQHASARLWT